MIRINNARKIEVTYRCGCKETIKTTIIREQIERDFALTAKCIVCRMIDEEKRKRS